MTYAVMCEGMDEEQRAEFDRLLAEAEGSGDHDEDAAARRAYALAYGEQD